MKEQIAALRNRVKVIQFQLQDLQNEITKVASQADSAQQELAVYKTENGQLEKIVDAYHKMLSGELEGAWEQHDIDTFEREALQ